MTLREKYCKHCEKFFYYEDGVDSSGVGLTREDSLLKAGNKDKVTGFCPICVDPHAIPGMTYRKSTIIYTFKKHLQSKGIDVSVLDDENLASMLREFPKANSLYTTGTYNTFTLLPGLTFSGKHGEYILGNSVKKTFKRKGYRVKFREVSCVRCNRIAFHKTKLILQFFLGLRLKICKICDYKDNFEKISGRNTSGLNRNGSKPSEFSSRSLAKALNVSKNDFLRHKITKPEPPLPVDTVINGLRIEEAYWCNKTCSPRYILVCDDCNDTFEVLQKRVRCLQHYCPVRMKK